MFPKLDQRLVLTNPNGAGVSRWRLPRWFYPDGNKPPMTYHPDRKRWRREANHAYLQSVGRGQEFVRFRTVIDDAYDSRLGDGVKR